LNLFLQYFQQQPKAIRDAFYRQEIVYPGAGANTLGQGVNTYVQQQPVASIVKPILPPSVRLNSIPAETPAAARLPNPETFISIPARPIGGVATRLVNDETVSTTVRPKIALPSLPPVITTTTPRITTSTEPLTSEELEEQAKSAHYNFDTSVHDTINDHMHVRSEKRDGLALTGMYSYSDGFFKRTVHYEADEGGYRVIKEMVEPIAGNGPKFNPNGQADVRSTLTGDYVIGIEDFKLNKKQLEIVEQNERRNL
jgi:hypothetical protein